MYFAALFKRFSRTCVSRVGSASSTIVSGGNSTDNVCPRFLQMAEFLDRIINYRAQLDRLFAELDSSSCDTRHIQQVIDETGHLVNLAVDHFSRPLQVASAGPLARKIWTAFLTGAKGLRSSWARIAKNSSLRRSDSLSAETRFAFSMAITARFARSSATRRSLWSYTRPDSAVTNVIAPSTWLRDFNGTQM